jgi:hypothetical protein
MSYLHYLCLFAYNGVQHILCCVFALLFFALLPSMLPVSLDCPFLIAPSVFSNVYVKVACKCGSQLLIAIKSDNIIRKGISFMY